MTKLPVFDQKGTKLTSMTVSDLIFAVKVNQPLMDQASRVYLSNQRRSLAKTKRRGEVKVTKAKVWRQKGTGRARHGSRNAPIFVGGGQAHGPTGEQNYKRTLSTPMKRQSLFSALTFKLKNDSILVVDKLDTLKPKTAIFDKLFSKITKNTEPVLLLIDKSEGELRRPTRNLSLVTPLTVTNLNTYQTLTAGKLIFTKTAVKSLAKHYGIA